MSDSGMTKKTETGSPGSGQTNAWLFAKAVLMLIGVVLTIVVVQWVTT